MTEATTLKTRSQTVAADIVALLRARHALLWVVTREERRVEGYLFEAAIAASYMPRTWDVGQGVCDINGRPEQGFDQRQRSPDEMLTTILNRSDSNERGVWIMRDLPVWIAPGLSGATVQRQLRNLARYLPDVKRESAQCIIIISPSADIPPELQGHATVIDWPIPDRSEIAGILDAAVDVLSDDMAAKVREGLQNGTREKAIDAAVGLSGEEASACYGRSLVQLRRIDPAEVAKEKKRVIARERVLEWYDPIPGGLDAVGGLDVLKEWLVQRASAYTKQAREYGLPAPRGALLVGVPGCGKSLTAKAISTAWQVPLLRMDLGALKSKFVGESEGNLRRAFSVIEALGRCVVWLDEIEKSLAGATDGSADGGVSADALGAVLNWMQERQGQSFVIATANDVSKLPPELLRKGRFDELFFVDLPNYAERVGVLRAALKQHGRGHLVDVDSHISLESVAEVTADFTGSEVAALVPDALYEAFNDGAREIKTIDLIAAAKTVAPLSKTAGEKIAALRTWAQGRARRASRDVGPVTGKRPGRQLDLA